MNLLKEWEKKIALDGKSDLTFKAYKDDIEMFFGWLDKDITLDNLKTITSKDVNDWMYYLMKERENSESTRARRIKSIKNLYNTMQELKYISKDENISEELKSPKIPQREMVYLNEEEAQNLVRKIQGCHRTRDVAIVMLFLTTGLRLSELIGIDIKDIKGNQIKVLGKGNKERTVYINDNTMQAINEWLEIRPNVETNALFVSERNNRLSIPALQYMIKANLKRIDRPDCSTHKLRHTSGTMMANAGNDIKTIQKTFGHSDIKTTAKYVHAIEKNVERAINSIPISL